MMRALLRTQGYFIASPMLAAEHCFRLLEDVWITTKSGPCVHSSGGIIRAISLLTYSDVALELLDQEELSTLVDEALGDDAVLSRAEGVIWPSTSQKSWQSDFDKLRLCLPARSFRPGIVVLIPLSDDGGILEVLRASQHMNPTDSINEVGLLPIQKTIAQGCSVLLDSGVSYRLLSPGTIWLGLAFVRPWIKPEVLFSSALSKERLDRLGVRGRRLCGVNLGLPTSIEEFLAIETAALDSAFGRAKGSGI